MNQYIDQVISKNIKFAKPIIEGEGEIYYCPWFKEFSYGEIVRQVSYYFVLYDVEFIVKNKGIIINIAINNKSTKSN